MLTFGFSVLISEMVLGNSALTGGFDGTRPDPPTIFGIEVDALRHPGRYGFVVLVALTAMSLLVANLRRGRAGRRLLAVRGNERAAAALGVSVQARSCTASRSPPASPASAERCSPSAP